MLVFSALEEKKKKTCLRVRERLRCSPSFRHQQLTWMFKTKSLTEKLVDATCSIWSLGGRTSLKRALLAKRKKMRGYTCISFLLVKKSCTQRNAATNRRWGESLGYPRSGWLSPSRGLARTACASH